MCDMCITKFYFLLKQEKYDLKIIYLVAQNPNTFVNM